MASNWITDAREDTRTISVRNSDGSYTDVFVEKTTYPDRDTNSVIDEDEKSMRSKRVLDPNGVNRVYTWDYTSGRLTGITQPDGYWENYKYHSDAGRYVLWRKQYPYGNEVAISELDYEETETTVDDTSYSTFEIETISQITTSSIDAATITGQRIQESKDVYANNEIRDVSRYRRFGNLYEAYATLDLEVYPELGGEWLTEYYYDHREGSNDHLSISVLGGLLKQEEVTIRSGVKLRESFIDTTPFGYEESVLHRRSFTSLYDNAGLYFSVVNLTDDFGRPLEVGFPMDGTKETFTYDCCGLDTMTSRTGAVLDYERGYAMVDLDGDGKLTLTRFESEENRIPDNGSFKTLTLTTFYDALNNVVAVIKVNSSDSITTVYNVYNKAGELIESHDPEGRKTEYGWVLNGNDQKVETITAPGGSERVITYCPDGRIARIEQDGQMEVIYDYAVISSAVQFEYSGATQSETVDLESVKAIYQGDVANPVEWEQRLTDPFGRLVEMRRSLPGGNEATTKYVYDKYSDRVVRIIDADGIETKFEHNVDGSVHSIDGAKKSEYTIAKGSRDSEVVVVESYFIDENSTGFVTAHKVERATSGLKTWITEYDAQTETVIDVEIDRANSTVTTTTTYPDGTALEQIEIEGYLVSSRELAVGGATITEYSYSYDDFGRLSSVLDHRNDDAPSSDVGEATFFDYYADGALKSMTTPATDEHAAQTTYYYSSGHSGTGLPSSLLSGGKVAYSPDLGLQSITVFPDDAPGDRKFKAQQLDPKGNIVKQWGARTYPVEYHYDNRNRLLAQTTWQEFNEATGAGVSGDVTTGWIYDDAGRLWKKRFDTTINQGVVSDTAGSSGGVFTYTDAGRLDVAINGRGMESKYEYDSLGRLEYVDFGNDASSASEKEIHYSYHTGGQLSQIDDSSGSRTLTYEFGKVALESYTAGPLSGSSIERDFVNSLPNRLDSLTVGGHGLGLVEYEYDSSTGRYQGVSVGTISTETSYHPYSHLPSETIMKDGALTFFQVRQDWDSLNRLNSIKSLDGLDQVLEHAEYGYNVAGQRDTIADANSDYWDIEYDVRGQIDTAVKKTASHAAYPGLDFDYDFDAIGNRSSVTIASPNEAIVTAYTPNELNQYVNWDGARDVPVYMEATPGATVTVNSDPAEEQSGFFFGVADFTSLSASSAHWEDISVEASVQGQPDVQVDYDIYLPTDPVSPSYDDDGNLTFDGRWNYQWNVANRLEMMWTSLEAAQAGAPIQVLVFEYDSQGRRFHKVVYDYLDTLGNYANSAPDPSNGAIWDEVESLYFLYDDWNLVAEFTEDSGSLDLDRSYVWGPDLSGTMQGAGGVGGLLWMEDHDSVDGGVFVPAYDGNGNVLSYYKLEGPETDVVELPTIGIPGDYYSDTSFGSLVGSQVVTRISYNWSGYQEPMSGTGWNNFSIRWTAKLEAPEDGNYTFYVEHFGKDLVRLKIDGQTVLEDWVADTIPATETSGSMTLNEGQEYELVLEFADLIGQARAILRWSGPDISKRYLDYNYLYYYSPQTVDYYALSQVADYEYGPFGETIKSVGIMADEMPFQFSTKYRDAETGLYYYGYRYYDVETGRWLSRDPIGEQGGLNLYGMVGNDLISYIDILGLILCEDIDALKAELSRNIRIEIRGLSDFNQQYEDARDIGYAGVIGSTIIGGASGARTVYGISTAGKKAAAEVTKGAVNGAQRKAAARSSYAQTSAKAAVREARSKYVKDTVKSQAAKVVGVPVTKSAVAIAATLVTGNGVQELLNEEIDRAAENAVVGIKRLQELYRRLNELSEDCECDSIETNYM